MNTGHTRTQLLIFTRLLPGTTTLTLQAKKRSARLHTTWFVGDVVFVRALKGLKKKMRKKKRFFHVCVGHRACFDVQLFCCFRSNFFRRTGSEKTTKRATATISQPHDLSLRVIVAERGARTEPRVLFVVLPTSVVE